MTLIFPGLTGGIPILKKTQTKVISCSYTYLLESYLFLNSAFFLVKILNLRQHPQEVEPKPESKNDAPEEDDGQRKPKWMPPRQPG